MNGCELVLETPQNVALTEYWIKTYRRYRGYSFRNEIRDKDQQSTNRFNLKMSLNVSFL